MSGFLIDVLLKLFLAQRLGRIALFPVTVRPSEYAELAELEKITRKVSTYFDAIELLGKPTGPPKAKWLDGVSEASPSDTISTDEVFLRLLELWQNGGCPRPKLSFCKRLSYGFLDPEPRMACWAGISGNSFRMLYKEYSRNFDIVVAVERSTGKAAARMFRKGAIDLPPYGGRPIPPLTEMQLRRVEKESVALS